MHMTFAKEQPSPVAEISIRQFQPGDAAAFRSLNEEWITRFFRIEPKEEPILADPQATILDSGGRIFFATAGERCVGCCALIRIRDKEFELAKMAVAASCGDRRSAKRRRAKTLSGDQPRADACHSAV
jgi:hypothetical protein